LNPNVIGNQIKKNFGKEEEPLKIPQFLTWPQEGRRPPFLMLKLRKDPQFPGKKVVSQEEVKNLE